MQRYIFHLLNLCFAGHNVPRIWKLSHIKPLYKGKGNKTEPSSYRGISLLSCMYNLFTGLIYQRLRIWVERNQILPSSQYGFRRKLSTIDAVSHLKKAIKHNISCNGKYYACFIDYEKAFDFVNRNLLLTKLIKMELHGNMLHAIQSVLKCNFQQIFDGEFLSNEIEQKPGVAQGDKLSPLLFSLFIADLYFELKCKALDVIFYADDLVPWSHRQCHLQQTLNNLNTYNLNTRGGRLAVDEKCYISKRENEFTNTFCYLGVFFSSTLSPSHHLEHLMNKTYQSVASINQKLNLQKVSFNSAQHLFNSIVFQLQLAD